eukprot:7382815-Prymnesium_polylepis.1
MYRKEDRGVTRKHRDAGHADAEPPNQRAICKIIEVAHDAREGRDCKAEHHRADTRDTDWMASATVAGSLSICKSSNEGMRCTTAFGSGLVGLGAPRCERFRAAV